MVLQILHLTLITFGEPPLEVLLLAARIRQGYGASIKTEFFSSGFERLAELKKLFAAGVQKRFSAGEKVNMLILTILNSGA